MYRIIFILLILCGFSFPKDSIAQSRYKMDNALVNFYAGTPLEDIDGTSDKLVGVIDTLTKGFAFRIAMNSFQFPRKLMQEHYNENYLETDTYPNASFKGEINGSIDWKKAGSYEVIAKGEFDVHGIKKTYEIPANISISEDGGINLESSFSIKLSDHKIKRPKIVLIKIAEKASVSVKANLIGIN